MSKKIINLLYNPGSISTAGTGKETDDIETQAIFADKNQSTYATLTNKDCHLLESLENLVQANHEQEIIKRLGELRDQISLGVSTSLRPAILKEYNQYLSWALVKYPQATQVFEKSLEVIIKFKKHIDDTPQTNGFISQLEWVELERSVFCLSEWEDGMKQKQEFSYLTP